MYHDSIMDSKHLTEHIDRTRKIERVLWIVLVLNLLVAAAKFVYGLISNSAAMQADGIHSAFDTVGNIVGIIGITLAARPADTSHPYGHSKFETYGSAIIGIMLFVAAFEVGSSAVERLVSGHYTAAVTPISFIVMAITLVVNLAVSHFERKAGKQLSSDILLADSAHTLSDSIVSIGVIAGLVFVAAGYPIADPIMALVVTFFIVLSGVSVFRRALRTLADHSRIDADELARIAYAEPGVREVHRIRTRGTESEVYCDLHLLVDPAMTVLEADHLCDKVEANIKQAFPNVCETLIHIEPFDAEHSEGEADLASQSVAEGIADASDTYKKNEASNRDE